MRFSVSSISIACVVLTGNVSAAPLAKPVEVDRKIVEYYTERGFEFGYLELDEVGRPIRSWELLPAPVPNSIPTFKFAEKAVEKAEYPDVGAPFALQIRNRKFAEGASAMLGNLKSLQLLELASSEFKDVDLKHCLKLEKLTHLDLSYTSHADPAVKICRSIPGLTSLVLCKIEITDACFEELARYPSLISLDCSSCSKLTSKVFGSLPKFKHLTRMDLSGLQVSLADCKILANLPLRDLHLRNSGVDGDGLAEIAKISTLTHLDIAQSTADEAAIEALTKLKSLQHLGLNNTNCTDNTIERLLRLKNLSRLELRDTFISDKSAAHFAKMPGLEYLYLDSTSITDDGVKHLTALTELRALYLAGTPVTWRSAALFGQMKSLRELDLPPNMFTKDSLKLFELLLPKCRIFCRIDERNPSTGE